MARPQRAPRLDRRPLGRLTCARPSASTASPTPHGLLPDPGTRLPYDRSDGFAVSGTGFEGEPLEGSFDYVVAIDYNREPGASPWT